MDLVKYGIVDLHIDFVFFSPRKLTIFFILFFFRLNSNINLGSCIYVCVRFLQNLKAQLRHLTVDASTRIYQRFQKPHPTLWRLINKLAILSSAARCTSSLSHRACSSVFLSFAIRSHFSPSFPKERRDFWIDQTRARKREKWCNFRGTPPIARLNLAYKGAY